MRFYRDVDDIPHTTELRALVRSVRVLAYRAGIAEVATGTACGDVGREYHAAVQRLVNHLDRHNL